MTAPFLTQLQHVAVKLEGTEGTDSVPADADVVAPAFDIGWTPTPNFPERNVQQASFSRLPRVSGEISAQISFMVELKGSGAAGTAPTQLSSVLRSCGLGETIVGGVSVTYAPASTALSSATVEIREASTVAATVKSKKIVGARGTFIIAAVKGNVVLVQCTYTGRYVEPTETTPFATPTPGSFPESFLGAAFSFHGVGTLLVQNVSIDMANNIVLRNDANQATGNFSAAYTGRTPTASIDPEQELIATINFFNKLTTNSEGAMSYVLGSTAGNITTVTAPKVQIIGISEADRDTLRTEAIELALNQSATAGDDEISIAFT